jgi:hypothetical protein
MKAKAKWVSRLGVLLVATHLAAPHRARAAFGAESVTSRSWWAFQPVSAPEPPQVRNPAWVSSPIDRFILAKLEARDLHPAARAEPEVLLRRVYFDLTGLPPTPGELEAFRSDPSPAAFTRVVDQLLASPRYGERWGRHWMDVVRYADTAGDNADYPVPEARRYRDFIIDSFNADKSYAQFVREQLAGDLLAGQGSPEQAKEHVVATGFLALSRRYATAPFEFMHLTIEDAIETTGRAFLGMTLRCARCHDHKYDPVTKEDYYAVYGIFASTRFPYAGSEEFQSKNFGRSGFVPLQSPDEIKDSAEANRQRIETLRAAITRLEKESETAKTNDALRKVLGDRLKEARLELKRRDRFGGPPGVPLAYAVADATPVDEPLQVRGEPAERGAVVPRRAPCALGLPGELNIPPGASGRLELADWIAQPANPLTARVMVNRIWQHHFGKGLVGTPSNFGQRGELPTHPELLDYLATYFVAHDWSLKAVHRLILNSATWQQASVVPGNTTVPAAVDPANQLQWRRTRQRLEAEAIRDSMLFVAGALDLTRPGPHPFPPFEDWNWTQHNPFKAVYESDHRSVYLMTQRIQRHPFLSLFDAPDANTSTDVRSDSTVPLQALYLMNHPFVQTQAARLARRVLAQARPEDSRLRLACELTWSRSPTEPELARFRTFLDQSRHAAAAGVARGQPPGTKDPPDAEQTAWTSYARVLLTANEFFYVD